MYGVPLASYWFGIISLISIFGVLIFTYLVLKSSARRGRGKITFEPSNDSSPEKGIIRKINPTESDFAFISILILLTIEFYFDFMFFVGIIQGFSQTTAALSGAMAFIVWALITEIYRREFLPYVLMEKTRKRKAIPEREFRYERR
jgi:hypothetical protein